MHGYCQNQQHYQYVTSSLSLSLSLVTIGFNNSYLLYFYIIASTSATLVTNIQKSLMSLNHCQCHCQLTISTLDIPTPLHVCGSYLYLVVRFFSSSFLLYMKVARHTIPEGHFKVSATIVFVQRSLPPTPRAETGLPLLQ